MVPETKNRFNYGKPCRVRLTKIARGVLLLAFLAAVALTAPPALAQDDSEGAQPDGFDVAITGGLDGFHKPGRPVPINIVVRAEKLLAGELEVESTVGQLVLRHRLEIEVPGGSTKRFIVTVPTSAFADPRVTVRIRTDDEPTFIRRVELRADSNLELVGVMPLVANPDNIPRSSPLAVDAGTARLLPISPELFGSGLEGLRFFDSIVATAADLDALSAREAEAITAWVAAGGHLLVDEFDGPVPRIPSAWQPQSGQATAAEFGLVRLTEGAAKAGA